MRSICVCVVLSKWNICLDVDVRGANQSLRIEHVKGARCTREQSEFVGVENTIFLAMNSAQVNLQVSVDKDPQIIVAAKVKSLSRLIRKHRVKFGSEVAVVISAFIPEQPIIDREKVI